MQDDHWPEQKLRNVQLEGGQGGQAARVTVPPTPPPPPSLTRFTSRTTLWFRTRSSRAEAPRKSALRICRAEPEVSTQPAHTPAPPPAATVALDSW